MPTLGEIGTAITTLKSIAGVLKEAGRSDLYSAILSLQRIAQQAVEDNTRLAEENASLSRQVRELQEKIQDLGAANAVRDAMEWDGQMYWQGADGQRTDGPFCPKCYDGSEHRLARMVERGSNYMYCSVCKYGFRKPDAPSRVQHPRRSGWVNDW